MDSGLTCEGNQKKFTLCEYIYRMLIGMLDNNRNNFGVTMTSQQFLFDMVLKHWLH